MILLIKSTVGVTKEKSVCIKKALFIMMPRPHKARIEHGQGRMQ